MPTKIFVGNLSSDTTGEDLRPFFEQYGRVTECDVLRNFGFVHMTVEEEAEQAIKELGGTFVKGQRINVEKSTGSGKGGGRGGGGGGKMMGGRGGRGGGRGRGGLRGGDRDYDPYPPPRAHPYGRDPYPYDYYDRHYPERLPPPRPLPPDDRRLAYDREDRLPPPRDPYDRYPLPRYPPDRYAAYDRYPPRPADPYDRPPPDYYRSEISGKKTQVTRRLPEELPPPPGTRSAANGFEERGRPEAGAGNESYSSSYSSYYDRFYSKTPANGAAPPPARPGVSAAGRGGPMAPRGAAAVAAAAAARKQQQDQQSMLQTGPIYF
ncbi:RNA-binding protein lark-like isoform X3 [Mercenaria mercenaria]|uniref:RNA-binding protein lark-like isoform X3 n=1 Tax=Mercenaria mercenaria TaxID=6596 RepID=UPI00234EF806|nr:RNA-binding protein lark-like isoform X3 [Mercenaria mercenaria]